MTIQKDQSSAELLVTTPTTALKIYNHYMDNPQELDQKLREGEAKARVVAREVLNKVREKLGF